MPNPSELDKSKDKLKAILDVIKFSGFTKDLVDREEELLVSSVVRTALTRTGSGAELKVQGDEAPIKINSSHLAFVISGFIALANLAGGGRFELAGLQLLITGTAKDLKGLRNYALFSDFASNFDADFIQGPLIDCLILKNNWRFSARFEGDEFFILLGT
jgi:hypothetical protein